MHDFPRRNRIDQFVPAEKAIYDAVGAVEATGADVRLTDAVVLLQRARDRVADYVDGVNPDTALASEVNAKTQSGGLEVFHTRDGRFMVGHSKADEAGGFAVVGDITEKVPFIVSCAEDAKPTTGMNFGQAIAALKAGKRVARAGWNGKSMWIVYMSGMSLPPYSTQGTDRKVNDRTAKWIGEDTPLDTLPYIAMWTADKKWLPGWLASQTDMLADDWCVVDQP